MLTKAVWKYLLFKWQAIIDFETPTEQHLSALINSAYTDACYFIEGRDSKIMKYLLFEGEPVCRHYAFLTYAGFHKIAPEHQKDQLFYTSGYAEIENGPSGFHAWLRDRGGNHYECHPKNLDKKMLYYPMVNMCDKTGLEIHEQGKGFKGRAFHMLSSF